MWGVWINFLCNKNCPKIVTCIHLVIGLVWVHVVLAYYPMYTLQCSSHPPLSTQHAPIESLQCHKQTIVIPMDPSTSLYMVGLGGRGGVREYALTTLKHPICHILPCPACLPHVYEIKGR